MYMFWYDPAIVNNIEVAFLPLANRHCSRRRQSVASRFKRFVGGGKKRCGGLVVGGSATGLARCGGPCGACV